MQLPFLGGAYTGRSPVVSSQQCVNYFYEKGVDGESLVSTPGSVEFNSDYSGEVRGGIAFNNLAWFVIGNKLVSINSAGVSTLRGTIGTTTGRVSMAHCGTRTSTNNQIMIVDGTSGWIWDNSALTLTEISDADFVASEIVAFFDGYFVFNEKNSDTFWNTAQYDGTSITGTDFYVAEGDPDQIVSIVAEQRQLFILGEQTTSVWYNSGDADDLFQRFQGGYTQTGCAATFSAARFDNSVIWLSQNERGNAQVVRLAEGFQPKVVSTPEVNYQLSTYSTVSDAFAYVYQHEGHEFYVLTFPTAGKTWVYDASTQEWHERGHNINDELSRERYNCHVFAFGEHLFGDYANGKIYKMDESVGTVDGARVPRIRVSSNISDGEKRVRFASVQLDMNEGIGDPNTDDDARFWLSYAKDGGRIFNDEVAKSAGDTGDYNTRVIWWQLGSARNWVFRVRTWTPKPHVIKGLIGRLYGEPA